MAFTAIIGAAAVGSYAAQSSAADKNRKAAQYTADKNAETISKTQAANDALFGGYVDRGDKAGSAINDFLGLNGTQSQNSAFDNWRNSTGYKFQMDSGTNAINANKSTAGLLKSGATLKALTKYGQGLADTYSGNYVSALQGQQNAGLNAANSNASSNTQATGMQVNNNNNLLNSTQQTNTQKANALTDLLGNVVSGYNYGKGQSSYGKSSATSVLSRSDDGGYTPAPSLGAYSQQNVFSSLPY